MRVGITFALFSLLRPNIASFFDVRYSIPNRGVMLGVYGAAALVASGMIGAGILILPAIMSVFGTWSIVGWCIASLMAYSIAKIFLRLGVHFKGKAPGESVAACFGNDIGFLVSWGYFIAMMFSGAKIAITLGNYALPMMGIDFPAWAIGYFSVLALFLLNVVSFGSASLILIVLTIVKVLLFILIALFGFKNYGSYVPHYGPFIDILKSSSVAIFAFLGIEFAAMSSGNIKDPEKNVPKATMIGLLFSTLVFIGVHCAVLFTLPDANLSQRPVYDAAAILFSSVSGLAAIFGLIAVMSCLSTLNGILVVEANLMKMFAQNKWLPSTLGKSTKQGFAWFGAAVFLVLTFFIIRNEVLLNFSLNSANVLVGILYLSAVLVDMVKSKIDFYNSFAFISSLIILYNLNLTIFYLVATIFFVGYLIRRIAKGSV
jgi:APA family basic amino acid/polyamine antiporter